MIYCRRVTDLKTIYKTVLTPSVARHFTNGIPKGVYRFDSYQYPLVVGCFDDAEYLGCFIFEIRNSATLEIHACMLPISYGTRALQAARCMLKWIWNNTPFRRINAMIGVSNRLAIAYAKRGGMKEVGYLKDGHYLDDAVEDQIILGITKEECNG